MKQLPFRYKWFIIMLVILAGTAAINYTLAAKIAGIAYYSLKEMLCVIPMIFLLLGLLDVWVPKETIVRHLGAESGLKGIALSFLLGAAASGPLYGAFPVAAVMMKKGAKFNNILIFIGAWSTTKIPMLLFEISNLGPTFALTRLLVNIPIIVLIAFILPRLVTEKEIEEIYENAKRFAD